MKSSKIEIKESERRIEDEKKSCVCVMNMNKKEECSKSHLPEELWEIIFKKLKTTPDVVRFRSICSSWRSFLPFTPLSHNLRIPHQRYVLLQTKIYRIQPLLHDHDPSASSSCSNKGWLIKVFQNSNSSKFYLLNLFSNMALLSEDKTTHKVLNLMNVRVVELFELYTLCQTCETNFEFEPVLDELFELYTQCQTYETNFGFKPVFDVRKVILFSVEGRCMVFTLHDDNILKVSNIGKMKTTILNCGGGENNWFDFDDIILYKGQLYAVDKLGTIFWINALSLKLVQFSPKNLSCGEKSHKIHIMMNSYYVNVMRLVEYDGSLYVVHLYTDNGRCCEFGYNSVKAIVVEVYKLDQEWGKWLNVKDLGDVSFVLGKDSNFAVLAQDYHGCERNCIYFYIYDRTYCFSLENLEVNSTNIFWPCPSLFHP